MASPLLLISLLLAGCGLAAARWVRADGKKPAVHYWWIGVGLYGVPSLGGLMAAFAPEIGFRVLEQLLTLALVAGSAGLALGAVHRLLTPFEESTGTLVLGAAIALFFAIQLTGRADLFVLAHAPATLALLGLGVRALENEKPLAPWMLASGGVLLLCLGLPPVIARATGLDPVVAALLLFAGGVLVFAQTAKRALAG